MRKVHFLNIDKHAAEEGSDVEIGEIKTFSKIQSSRYERR
jgi:hypothetical protein